MHSVSFFLSDHLFFSTETALQRRKRDRKARKKHRSKKHSSSEGEDSVSEDDEGQSSKVPHIACTHVSTQNKLRSFSGVWFILSRCRGGNGNIAQSTRNIKLEAQSEVPF